MRTILHVLIAASISMLAWPLQAHAATWSVAHVPDEPVSVLDVAPFPSGGFVLAGWLPTTEEIWVARAEADGSLAWQRALLAPVPMGSPGALAVASDGTVAVSSGAIDAAGADAGVVLLDGTGGIMAEIRIEGLDAALALAFRDDGALLVAGPSAHDVWLGEVTRDGTLAASASFRLPCTDAWGGNCSAGFPGAMAALADGGVALGLETVTSSGSAAATEVMVLALDANLHVRWAASPVRGLTCTVSGSSRRTVEDLAVLPDGDVVVVGGGCTRFGDPAYVARLDATGLVDWVLEPHLVIGEPASWGGFQGLAFEEETGDLLAVGSAVVRITGDGSVASATAYPGTRPDLGMFHSAVREGDGWRYAGGGGVVRIVRSALDGTVDGWGCGDDVPVAAAPAWPADGGARPEPVASPSPRPVTVRSVGARSFGSSPAPECARPAPQAVSDLALERVGDMVRLTWSPADDAATHDVVSGAIGELGSGIAAKAVSDDACDAAAGLLVDATSDGAAATSDLYYLVVAVNEAGATIAPDSSGRERPAPLGCR